MSSRKVSFIPKTSTLSRIGWTSHRGLPPHRCGGKPSQRSVQIWATRYTHQVGNGRSPALASGGIHAPCQQGGRDTPLACISNGNHIAASVLSDRARPSTPRAVGCPAARSCLLLLLSLHKKKNETAYWPTIPFSCSCLVAAIIVSEDIGSVKQFFALYVIKAAVRVTVLCKQVRVAAVNNSTAFCGRFDCMVC